MDSSGASVTVGFLLYTNVTQLDLTGPHEVLVRAPNTKVLLVAKQGANQVVVSEKGIRLLADVGLDDCPPLDVLCIPGGPGQVELMDDEEVLAFVRRQAETSVRYLTSVCTGALVLGAAGLLQGVKATTHWMFTPMLGALGAEVVEGQRVVRAEATLVNGRTVTVVTGGGVTAGIDFGLGLVAEMWGLQVAEAIQLGIEYCPAPPLPLGVRGGDPAEASAEVKALVIERGQALRERRTAANERAAQRLKEGK